MEKNQFYYRDVVKKYNFKVEQGHDSVYEEMYGHEYLIVTKKLTKTISLDWDQQTLQITLYRTRKKNDSHIEKKFALKSEEELILLIKTHTDEIVETQISQVFTQAC